MDHEERLKAALADRYQLKREIGSGGMAKVYLARDLKHDRQVAVKVLRPEVASSLGNERFFDEIRLTARLQHPHIVPLFDSGEADGFLYYVMPYIQGESLRATLEREGIATFNDGPGEDGSIFINYSALARLHSGAIWQMYTRIQKMVAQLADHGIQLQLEANNG